MRVERGVRCDEARAPTITAYPLLIRAEGSMKVADFDWVGYGRTGTFGLIAGFPTGSWSSEKSSVLETYGGQVALSSAFLSSTSLEGRTRTDLRGLRSDRSIVSPRRAAQSAERRIRARSACCFCISAVPRRHYIAPSPNRKRKVRKRIILSVELIISKKRLTWRRGNGLHCRLGRLLPITAPVHHSTEPTSLLFS